MQTLRMLILLPVLLLLPAQAGAAGFFAAQLTQENLHRLPAGGLDAIGGNGDWLLTDGELCAVVSGADHPTYLALHGGALVDLWHCALANDQWSVAHTQLNMQKDQIPPTTAIQAGYDQRQAWLQVTGARDGLEASVRYRLEADRPGELAVETTVTRTGAGARMGTFASLLLHPRASLTPFTVDSAGGAASPGFDQPDIDTSDFRSVLAAVGVADLQVLLGSRHLQPTISYAVALEGAWYRDPDGHERPVHTFLISGRTFSMFGAFARPFPRFWPDKPGMLSFALGQLLDLEQGHSLVFRQRISASPRGDAASLLDRLYGGARVSGQLDTAEAGITVRDAAGAALSFARPDAQGRFDFRLPAAVTKASAGVRTPWGEVSVPISVSGAALDLGLVSTGAVATLALPQGDAMSLVLQRDGASPVFHDELTGGTVAGRRQLIGPESQRLSLAGVASDPATLQLAPGRYRVLASRGPEFSVSEARVELRAATTTALRIAPPRRVVATPNLLGADFHVHSGVSFDSSLSPQQRVRDFAAQGGELLVATEHNITYDLGPVVEDMGLDGIIATLPGVELTGMARSAATPTTIGHSNVFPVAPDPQAFMGGTLPFEGKRLGQVIGDYKRAFPHSVFQLNHPRSEAYDDDISFFNHLSFGSAFDPSRPLSQAPNHVLLERHAGSAYRDIDFDSMELLNGESLDLYRRVRSDWFALLRQDQYKVATANSDSHASSQLVALPRSYLVVADDPANLDTGAVLAALRRGALYGSTGPILRIDLSGAGPGDTHAGSRATLHIAIDGAPWVDVSEARLWLNGELWQTLPATPGARLSVPVAVSRDSFLFVEVAGEAGDIYRVVAPGFTPFAFANPVFLDVDGDGWRYGEAARQAAGAD